MIDKSVNQSIWNKGTLVQGFDDHSVTATDHSVAAGRDLNGDVANDNGRGNSVGNTTSTHSDDHSINDSFTSTDIADHGSNTATNGSDVDNSRHIDNSHTTTDSGNTTTVTHVNNHPDDSLHINNHPDNSVTDSGNSTTIDHSGNDSLNDHTQIDHSRVSQHGLVNIDHVASDDNIPLHLL